MPLAATHSSVSSTLDTQKSNAFSEAAPECVYYEHHDTRF